MHKKHRHSQCVNTALERAEQVCRQKGVRLTAIRKKVLELVWQSHKPIKAYDLLAQLSTAEFLEKPPTVYRALQFLLEHQLIHRIESSNAYIGCTFDHEQADSKFLVCDLCNEVAEVYEPTLTKALRKTSDKQGFIAQQFNVEIHGTCARCAKD